MHTSLPYHISEPPAWLKKATLDNIALVPASLLPLKGTYQPLANRLPTGSVLCIPGTTKQQKIMVTIATFFRTHGHTVVTLPIERITKCIRMTTRPQTKNLHLAF